MTHGCLLIVLGDRKAMLHTYHTGQDIPHLPNKVMKTLAEYHFYINPNESLTNKDEMIEDIKGK